MRSGGQCERRAVGRWHAIIGQPVRGTVQASQRVLSQQGDPDIVVGSDHDAIETTGIGGGVSFFLAR